MGVLSALEGGMMKIRMAADAKRVAKRFEDLKSGEMFLFSIVAIMSPDPDVYLKVDDEVSVRLRDGYAIEYTASCCGIVPVTGTLTIERVG